jgi:hypothetical protein
MNPKTHSDILIRIDTIDQLFNAPDIDPFSDKTAIILGEPALQNAVQHQMGRGLRDWKGKRLVIQLPAAQITPDLQAKTCEAIRRYAQAKQKANDGQIRISRIHSLLGLAVAIALAIILLIVLGILLNTLLASASDIVKGLFVGIFTIFIWSTVWNPWDRLVYEWIAPWLENRILRSIMTMEIIIQAESG